jgi:outer membrane protein
MLRAVVLGAALVAAAPAAAQVQKTCTDGVCELRLTPQQLLAAVEKLVAQKRYAEAEPLVEALRRAPGLVFQTRFLAGYIAAGQGRWAAAADQYKAILADDPAQTRVRLELAKTFLAMGQYGSADKQFAVVERTRDLSPEIARTIRTVRNTIRANRPWQLDVNFGIAPDSNINNATAADTVTVMLGDTPIPLQLDQQARRRSGLGATARVGGSIRLPVAPKLSAIVDLDASGTEYKGGDYDTYVAQVAAGGELQTSEATRLSVQAIGARRWFGGPAVSRQLGVRLGGQTVLDPRRRLGLQIDARHTDALFNDQYSGWQVGAYGTFEQALSATKVASIGPYVRRETLRSEALSSVEFGSTLGIGGELKWGMNFGASVGVARTLFDAPVPFFSPDPRRDWQLFGRAALGNRKIRVWGLSPQLNWSVTRVASNIGFYTTTRSRFELTLARYF